MKAPLSKLCTVVAAAFAFGGLSHAEEIRREVTLAPGEGTILCLGSPADFAAVVQRYSPPAAAAPTEPVPAAGPETFRLDFLPFGFYLGTPSFPPYRKAAAALGVDEWTYYGRLLDRLKGAGANTVLVVDAEMSVPGRVPQLAQFIHAHGLRAIIQPGDAYFRGADYFTAGHEGPWRKFSGPAENYERALRPLLERTLPALAEETSIWAWSPTEELPGESEADFTAYKKLLRTLVPRHRHFQLDSQQHNAALLAAKQPPYPDVWAFDRYPWWTQPGNNAARHGENLYLWTPHFVARWLYRGLKDYTEGVRTLSDRPALAVLQGPAAFSSYPRDLGAKYGWPEDAAFIPPTAPQIRWDAARQRWTGWSMYLPPTHAMRLQSWLAICAGMKGMLLWEAVSGQPEDASRHADPSDHYTGILHYDLSATPQWEELSAAWPEIARFEKLLLALRPASEKFATTPDPDLFVNSFTDPDGRRYVIVVNGRIGTWDRTDPVWLDAPATKLSVGADGNLTGYTPLREPRACPLQLASGWEIHDLRSRGS